MRPSRLLVLVVLGTPIAAASAQSPGPTAAFASLRWLEGRWLGSGGRYPAFFEEYRVINDSTIEQREIADSTFTKVNGLGYIALRGGGIVKLNADQRQTAAIQVVGDTVAFASPNGRSYRWIRTGADGWRAELGSVSYLMKRIGR